MGNVLRFPGDRDGSAAWQKTEGNTGRSSFVTEPSPAGVSDAAGYVMCREGYTDGSVYTGIQCM